MPSRACLMQRRNAQLRGEKQSGAFSSAERDAATSSVLRRGGRQLTRSSRRLTSAPAAISRRRQSTKPPSAAEWSGVAPPCGNHARQANLDYIHCRRSRHHQHSILIPHLTATAHVAIPRLRRCSDLEQRLHARRGAEVRCIMERSPPGLSLCDGTAEVVTSARR